jgi:Cu/Ag efflux protein CusF
MKKYILLRGVITVKKVIFIFITVLIIAAAGLTACRLFGTPVEDTPENNGITVNKIIFEEINDIKGEKFAPLSLKNQDAAKNSLKEVRGVYVGQIDGGSIEIKVDGEARAYRYDDKLKSFIEGLNTGESIDISFFENKNGQLVIIEIKRKDVGREFKDMTGKYTGLIDNNSLEIDVDAGHIQENSGGPTAFRLTEAMQAYFIKDSKEFKNFQEGDRVVFNFVKNEYGQLILTKLEKVK